MTEYLSNLGLGIGITVTLGLFAISYFVGKGFFYDGFGRWNPNHVYDAKIMLAFGMFFAGCGIVVALVTIGWYYNL